MDSSSSVNCDGSTYSDASGWRTARAARRARANFVDAAPRLAAFVRGAARDAGGARGRARDGDASHRVRSERGVAREARASEARAGRARASGVGRARDASQGFLFLFHQGCAIRRIRGYFSAISYI